VVTASDGVEGIEILRQRTDEIDTVLLDMSMPKLSGVETFERLRALRPDLPVILTTGYGRDELGDLATAGDNVAFLQKPYPIAKLREVLAALTPAAKRSRQER
jgi:CheY-like chemotaxis protein